MAACSSAPIVVARTLVVLCTVVPCEGADARAEPLVEWLPGSARAISRTMSASRDVAAFEYAYGPRAQNTAGAEWGLLAFGGSSGCDGAEVDETGRAGERGRTRGGGDDAPRGRGDEPSRVSARLGMYGALALENGTSMAAFPAHELWRGMIGASFSLSLAGWARRALGREGGLEVSALVGHESDHHDGWYAFPYEEKRAGEIPDGAGGDFVTPDVAARWHVGGKLFLTVRAQDRLFVRGSLRHAPGADLILRWRVASWAQPTIALFAERLVARQRDGRDAPGTPVTSGGEHVRNGYVARGLVGVAFPGRVGEVTPFVAMEAGNGKGLLVFRREVRLAVGVRYAIF